MLRNLVYRWYEHRLERQVRAGAIPRHVGVLPDGNRRYARGAGLRSTAEGHRRGDDELVVGVALWAMRHEVAFRAIEPVENALARRSNAARGAAELSAAFGLMQGLIAHVAPVLAADLERSNPERPWRVLHVNFAITAIRSEDGALLEHAFDALDRALPDERSAFYAEAMALALGPRIAPAVREGIEQRHRRWTQA